VKIHTQRELGVLLAQPRKRAEPGSGFLDCALGIVDSLERCALERLEPLGANLADDGRVLFGAARAQRAVDRRIEGGPAISVRSRNRRQTGTVSRLASKS
jgi:hypothetical protein